MHRKWSSILAAALLTIAVALPLAAHPTTAPTTPQSWWSNLTAQLVRLSEQLVNGWLQWLNPERQQPADRSRTMDELPWRYFEHPAPNTGWVDKEGCSLDPLGRPIPPCPGGGG